MKVFIDAHVLDDLNQGSKTYLKGMYSSRLRQDTLNQYYFGVNEAASIKNEWGSVANAFAIVYHSHYRIARLGWEIENVIRKERIDWAHFQYVSPLRKTCNEIVTIHDILFRDFPEYFSRSYRISRDFLFRRSARRAEWVLTVSDYSKEALCRHYGIPPEKILITRNGILDFFWEDGGAEPVSGLNEGKFILYVSRFEPRKNHEGLLRAFIDLNCIKDGLQLVLVGGVGIQSPGFIKLYESLSKQDRGQVHFLQNLELPQLKWLYRRCALFVYPSFAEGFGIPPLEALACGANVLCSGTTAMSEFKFFGNRLFNPKDDEEFRSKMKYYLDHPETESLSGMQEFVREVYSWDSAAKELGTIFR